MKTISLFTFLLVVLGAINWMIFGLTGVDLVVTIFGSVPVLTKVMYLLIGVSGIYYLLHHKDHVTS